MPNPAAVNSMFARIARRYDFANRLLSGGTDIWWRRQLVRAVARRQPQRVLDLATGSGDVAFAISKHLPASVLITGMDFCQPMLDQAVKAHGETGRRHVRLRLGDARLPEMEDGGRQHGAGEDQEGDEAEDGVHGGVRRSDRCAGRRRR